MQVRQRVVYRNDSIYWYFNSKTHRDKDLPATYYFRGRKLIDIAYVQHGKSHRTIGPAYIDYDRKIKSYYYQDKEYSSLAELKMLEACK